jgi:2-isopropylmalate synthase
MPLVDVISTGKGVRLTVGLREGAKAGFKEGMWAVSPYNFDEEVRRDMHLPEKIQLMDMTLREGRQVAGVSVRLDEVLEFARRIDAVGVPIVEMHHDLIDEIKGVKALGVQFKVQALVHPTAALNPELCEKEVDLCLEAGSDIICVAFAISDYNFKLVESMGGLTISREEALDRACEAVQYGKRQGAFMNVNLMDFSRLDLEWLKTIVGRLKEAGVDILRIDDICAPCIPAVYKHHAWAVKQVLGPDVPMAIHSHDDFQLGTAGQLAALEGGAEILEGTINGLGERAGVPNLAVLASVLEIMYGYDTGINLEALQDLSEWVADVWNQPIPAHLAGTGHTAFSHAAEVHYALPEGDEWSFNAWSPKVIGNRAYVPLCHYSGPKAIQRKLEDEFGLADVDDELAERILERVRFELRWRRRELSARELTKIVDDAKQGVI